MEEQTRQLLQGGVEMKNLKLNVKFLVSFGLILVLFLVSVVATCSGIAISKAGYQSFYTQDFDAVTSVQDIKVKLQEALKEMLLIVESTDQQEYAQRTQVIDQNISDIRAVVERLCKEYDGDTTLLQQFESLMTNNAGVREHVMEQAALRTDAGNAEALRIIQEEYIPVVEEYTAVLNQAYEQIGGKCQTNYEGQMFELNGLLALGIAIAAAAFIITVILALRLSVSIAVPVKAIEAAMKEMVKGNLSVDVEYDSKDEFGSMADSMRKVTMAVSSIVGDIEKILGAMADGDFTIHSTIGEAYVGDYQKIFQSMKGIKDTFNETLATLNRSATQVSSGSDQVSSGAQALSQGATEQASSVEELAASINDVSNNINQTAHHAQEASNKSMQVGEKAGESNDRMQDMLQAMADINASSGEIGKIIKTIEDIAFQTNILALNAAVEAARAGAAGKGFAVVADEVRNLASKSAEASKNTAALIENSLQAVENGKRIADETAQSLEVVISDIQEASSMMDSIAKAATDQAESISQITLGIDQISSVVQTNSATAEESAAASEELSGQAQILSELVRKFKLDTDLVGSVSDTVVPVSSYEPDYSMDMNISYGGNDKY